MSRPTCGGSCPRYRRGRCTAVAAGLGDVIAALQAAGVLSPLSPVPGQVAAVCAGMRVSGHGITAPPAHDLPEPWLSLLAHYQRRKPDTTPVHDGYAAVAAALPELDGIRLALLGLLNADGSSWIKLLARGLGRTTGRDRSASIITFRCRSGSGTTAAAGTRAARPGCARPTASGRSSCSWCRRWPGPPTSIEVLAAGRSAQVRVRLPLRWGYPP